MGKSLNLPPPGVSTITATGGRRPVMSADASGEDATPARERLEPPTKRRIDPEQLRAALTAPQGKTVQPARKVPAPDPKIDPTTIRGGKVVSASPQTQITEAPAPRFRAARQRPSATFLSIDGREYTFDRLTKEAQARNPAYTGWICLLALVEAAKGGSIYTVLDAFGIVINDANNNPYYPLPPEIAEALIRKAQAPGSEEEFVGDLPEGLETSEEPEEGEIDLSV